MPYENLTRNGILLMQIIILIYFGHEKPEHANAPIVVNYYPNIFHCRDWLLHKLVQISSRTSSLTWLTSPWALENDDGFCCIFKNNKKNSLACVCIYDQYHPLISNYDYQSCQHSLSQATTFATNGGQQRKRQE